MSERYEQAVIERLSDRFGDVESADLASVLMETAKNAVEDNLQDYMPQLKSCTQDSLLEELDEYNIEVIYRQLAVNSVAYMLMSRCGVDTEAVFEREDFAEIINFNTPATINALGIATSDISEMALREISQTIRDVQFAEKNKNRTFAPQSQTRYDVGREQAERSNHNERNHIHQTRGLSYSRPNITDRARNSAWQIRFDAQGLSGAAQTSDLPQPADIGRAEQTSLRSGTDSSYEVGASDKTALQGAGRDGGTERKSTDAMGRTDEQYPQSSGGNDTERADLQLNVADEQQVTVNLPTVEEQIEMLAEAEDEKSSAFVISQEDIDSVFLSGSGFQNGKYRIYRQFQKNEDSKGNIDFLKKEYGTGGGTHYFPDGTQGHTWHDGKGIAILFLQKRDRVIDTEPDWVHLDTDENGITMNSYFVQHPEMILGEMKMESTRFGFDSACKAYQDIPLSELLHNAVQNIQGEIPEYENELDEISDGQDASIPADPNVRNFSYALVDGKVYFREDDRMTPAAASVTAENRIKGLIQIRDCVRKLIEYQTEDYPDDLIHTEQENLNRLYDSFTKQYGLINNRGNYLAFASDESYFLLCSLEVLDDEGNFKRKADMFTKRTIKPHREITSVETASEALALSIGEKARVDLPYMEQLTGKPKEEIIKDLQGVIFRIPATEPAQYVTADEYLSGNVRAKLITAEAAAKENPEFAVNAQALKQVIPQDLSAAEISVRLGTTWIPQEDIQRFVMELLTPSSYAQSRIRVRYTPINGDWFIENKSSDYGNVKADSTYGTKRASAYRIIEDTLNLRDTRIFDYVYDENGNKKAVFNAKETTAAQAKQEAIKQAFQDWIFKYQ